MDSRDFTLLLLGLVIGLVSWLLKELWSLHKRLETEVNELGKRLPAEFASKVDVRDAENRLNTKFDHIEASIIKSVDDLKGQISTWFSDIGDKIDRKADK